MLAVLDCLWEPLGPDTPVRVILIKDTTKPSGCQLALITTDLVSTAAQIVERYSDRWPIEVAFEDGKELFGVGQARNRTRNAVERTVTLQFLAMTISIVWYALHGHHPDIVQEHRERAPWYLTKTTPSFADILAKLRRTIIAAQPPQRGMDLKPPDPEIQMPPACPFGHRHDRVRADFCQRCSLSFGQRVAGWDGRDEAFPDDRQRVEPVGRVAGRSDQAVARGVALPPIPYGVEVALRSVRRRQSMRLLRRARDRPR